MLFTLHNENWQLKAAETTKTKNMSNTDVKFTVSYFKLMTCCFLGIMKIDSWRQLKQLIGEEKSFVVRVFGKEYS